MEVVVVMAVVGGGIVNGDGGCRFCLFVCSGDVARIPFIHRF